MVSMPKLNRPRTAVAALAAIGFATVAPGAAEAVH